MGACVSEFMYSDLPVGTTIVSFSGGEWWLRGIMPPSQEEFVQSISVQMSFPQDRSVVFSNKCPVEVS